MPRKSKVTLRQYRTADGTELTGAEFPSGRVVVHRDDLLMFYHDGEAVPLQVVDLSEGSRPHPRTGVGYRTQDVSGVSGEGVVFDFVHFRGEWVVQEWRNEESPDLETEGPEDSGMDFRPSMEMAVRIHGHNGGTEYVYDNGEIANDQVSES